MISELVNNLIDSGKEIATYQQEMTKGKHRFNLALDGASELLSDISGSVINRIDVPLKFLLIVSPECSDSAVAVPAFQKLLERTSNWTYGIQYKTEIIDDFLANFKIGTKETVPQILICTPAGNIISKWFDKSLSAKNQLMRIKKLELPANERKAKILDTPELHSKYEVKQVLTELLSTIAKATYYV